MTYDITNPRLPGSVRFDQRCQPALFVLYLTCIYIYQQSEAVFISAMSFYGCLLGQLGRRLPLFWEDQGSSPHTITSYKIQDSFFLIYVLKEHVLASQRGPAAAGAIEGGVEPTGMT